MGKQFRFPFRGKVDLPGGYNAKVGKRGLTIAESLLFGESATGVNMIAADGWRASYVNPPASFNPVGAPETITVTRQGFDATGTATTVNDTLTVMKRVRQAFPTQASLNQSDVALSDYVHFGDTISGGIYNASARVAPTPICMWLDHDLQRAIGQSYSAKLAVSHMFARSGRPVAAVKFIATDGTTTVEQTVSAMSKADYTATGLSVPHFAATLNLATLTANALITIDAIVYPWVGAAYRASVHGAVYPSINFTTLRVLNDNGSYGTAYAYCSPTGNDATGVTSATPSVAQALPYLTVAAAAAAIKVFNNANYSRNNTSGGIVRLEAGTFTHASFSASNSGNIPLVIEAANPANKATTIYRDSGVNELSSIPDAVKYKDIKIKRNASGNVVFFDSAVSTSRLTFENCTMDASGFGPSWGAYLYQMAFVTLVNCDGDDLGFATDFGADKKQINAIGATHSLGPVTYNLAGCKSIECYLRSDKFGVGNREAQVSRFIGFSFLGGNGTEILAHPSIIGSGGLALVGNILEQRGGAITPAVGISDQDAAGQNIVLQSNTIAGQRILFCYNDIGGSAKSGSLKFNVFHVYACKGDVFAANGGYIGNWPVSHHVGYRSNAYLRGDTQDNGFGTGQWLGELANFGEVTGTNAVPIVADWTLDASATGTGLGNGNYTPGASTALPFIPAGLAPYAWDLYGTPVSNTGTSRVGARQAAASGATGTASGSIALTGSSIATVRVAALATGSIGLTGTSQGAVSISGVVSGALPLSGSGVGAATVQGQAAGALPLSGAATGAIGAAPIAGTASGTIDLSGAAVATVLARGQAAGSLALNGTATAIVPATGAASGSLPLTGAAQGAVSVSALASGALPLSGASTGVVRVTGVANGDLPLSGTATGAIGNVPVTGVASGILPLTGGAAGAVMAAGVASGSLPLTGAASGRVVVAAQAIGSMAITGSATGRVAVFATASGLLTITGSSAAMVLLKAIAAGVLPISGAATGTVVTTGGDVSRIGSMIGSGIRGGEFLTRLKRGGGFLDAERGGTTFKGR